MPNPRNHPELDAAYAAFDEGRFEDALKSADAVLAKDPGHRDAALMHAACVDALGDAEAALQEYEDLCERFPDDAEIWLLAGELCQDGLDDPEMALEAFEKALDAATKEAHEDEEVALEAHLRLVDVYLDLGGLEESLEHAQAARALDRDSADAELAIGRVEFELARFEDAKKSAAKTIDKDPQHAGGYYLRGLVLERLGDAAGSRKAFRRAEELEPEVFPAGKEVAPDELRALAGKAMDELPPAVRAYLRKLDVVIEDLPSDADLAGNVGQLSPASAVAMKGTPLAEEAEGNPFEHLPSALVLYRLNLCRACKTADELKEELAACLIDEVGSFLNLSGDDLVDSPAGEA